MSAQTAAELPYDPECPACTGATEGRTMDLCDDHLLASLRPALRRMDRLRAAADRAEDGQR